jgi:hypothetical protein
VLNLNRRRIKGAALFHEGGGELKGIKIIVSFKRTLKK